MDDRTAKRSRSTPRGNHGKSVNSKCGLCVKSLLATAQRYQCKNGRLYTTVAKILSLHPHDFMVLPAMNDDSVAEPGPVEAERCTKYGPVAAPASSRRDEWARAASCAVPTHVTGRSW